MVNHTAINQLKMQALPELILANETQHRVGFDTTTMSPLMNTTLNPNENKCAIATVAKKSVHV